MVNRKFIPVVGVGVAGTIVKFVLLTRLQYDSLQQKFISSLGSSSFWQMNSVLCVH